MHLILLVTHLAVLIMINNLLWLSIEAGDALGDTRYRDLARRLDPLFI